MILLRNISIRNPYRLVAFLFVLGLMVFTMCMTILSVDQPTAVDANETFQITVQVDVEDDDQPDNDDTGDPYGFVFSILAPRAWAAASITTVRFESTVGNTAMRLVNPDEIDSDTKTPWNEAFLSKFGTGENYGEVEWITFIAEENFSAPTGATGTVFIETTAGPDNLITQMGYGISNDIWGLSDDNFDVFFTDCMTVSNGSGFPQNLCGPRPRQLVEQSTFTLDDLITIVFDASEGDNSLVGASAVYFCATATSGSTAFEICEVSDETKFEFLGNDIWELTIWPRSYFGIPEGDPIDFLQVSFTNASGSIEIRNSDGSQFVIPPKCFD